MSALHVSCPTCVATVGNLCVTKSGGTTSTHKARLRAAVNTPAPESKPAYQPGKREETEEIEPGQIDDLDDARAILRNATFGWTDPTLDPIEVIRGIVASTSSYYTEDQWSERETAHEDELRELRASNAALEEERDLEKRNADAARERAARLETDLRVSVETSGLVLADLTAARDKVLELERRLESGTLARVLELENKLAEIRKLAD